MIEELFWEVRDLAEKKRKNEEMLSKELLETKYKKSYETLCSRLIDAQSRLRVCYMESIREVSALVSDTVYMDFSQKESLEQLIEKCSDMYARYHDPFTKNLLVAVQKTVGNFMDTCGQKEKTS